MKKSINLLFIVLLVILMGALGFFSYKLISQENKILVPNFENSNQSEVNDWCNSLETNPCIFNNDYSETVPENCVIYQSVSPDNELGENITFIISLGKKIEIATPNVDDKTTKDTIETWKVKNDISNSIEYIFENNDSIKKNYVIRIEPSIITNSTDSIKVYISKGEKNEEENDDIEVVYEKYIGLSEEEFKSKVKELKLTPNHNEERDDYSEKIVKGKIVWHGSGSYIENEKINYGLSLGKKENTDQEITIKKGQLVGKTLSEFESAVKELGLVAEHSKNYEDSYSDTIAKGSIDWHGSGDYVKGEKIHYTLSLGKKDGSSTDIVVKSKQYVGKTLDEFKKICEELGIKPEHSEVYSDSYSDTIEKGCVDWHGQGTYVKNEVIHYTISLGKKDGGSTSKEIIVKKDQFLGLTLDEFKKKCTELGIVPAHSEVHSDDYSDTIAKGCIDWHGQGTYVNGEIIHYTLSLGKKNSDTPITPIQPEIKTVNVDSNAYLGKTVDEFKTTMAELGLSTNYNSSKDSYSSYPEGTICWYNSGSFNEGSTIAYGKSLGVEQTAVIPLNDIINSYSKTSYSAAETAIRNYFVNICGFANSKVTITGENATVSEGVIVSVKINGKDLGNGGNYPKNASVDVVISSGFIN